MTKLATMSDVTAELEQYAPSRMSNAVYNLDRIRALLEYLGNPQNDLKVVHITGTSGKTSTAYYVRALLESTGAKVGLTVSPHIQSLCERVQVGGGPISEQQFVEYFNEFYSLVFDFQPRPTYFELMTAFAYWVFNKEHVDYAVVEVGLGGRYDATNVVSRDDKVCIINSIGYDHTELLGDTLTAIAGEKSGIIQPNNVVFTVEQEEEAEVVIVAEAKKQHAQLTVVRPVIDHSSSVPAYQQHNFQLALAAVRYVISRDNLTLPDGAEQIVTQVTVPGRFELYTVGKKTIVLDGAHNPQKLEALVSVLKERHMQPAVVIAALSEAPEKKVAECVQLLSDYASQIIYTTFTVQRDVMRRSTGLDVFSNYAREQDRLVELSGTALEMALENDEQYIVVTGSLYLVSILRPFVQRLAGLSD